MAAEEGEECWRYKLDNFCDRHGLYGSRSYAERAVERLPRARRERFCTSIITTWRLLLDTETWRTEDLNRVVTALFEELADGDG